MVRVAIEVRSGAARFSVAVRAESIRRALSIAGSRYPGSNVAVRFPIDPESFFAKEPAATEGPVALEERERVAA
jgi:hypothetical protein